MGTPNLETPVPISLVIWGPQGPVSLRIWGPWIPKTLVIWGSLSDLGTQGLCSICLCKSKHNYVHAWYK